MTAMPETTEAAPTDLRRIGAHPDHWYPVAWSRELKAGKSFATGFAGEPIVLVRPLDGPVFALEDRCAHRQVPLSKGVVDGCSIRCCYHGWRYDNSGRCIDVPYLGKGKLPNGVRSYPCFERDRSFSYGRAWPLQPIHPTASAPRLSPPTRRAGSEKSCSATTLSCTRT